MGALPVSLYASDDFKFRGADDFYMREAIRMAERAASEGEQPFACIIVQWPSFVLAKTVGTETPEDPTRHSEVEAIRKACGLRGGLLRECTIYSTHEPCMMCCGAIVHSKVERVVYGSFREDRPDRFRARHHACGDLLEDTTNPPQVVAGLRREECAALFDLEIAAPGVLF